MAESRLARALLRIASGAVLLFLYLPLVIVAGIASALVAIGPRTTSAPT